MRSSRPTVALGVMVAALLVWLVVRSRLPAPSPSAATDRAPVAMSGSTPGNVPPVQTLSTDATTQSPPAGTPSTPAAQQGSIPTPAAGPSTTPNRSVPVASTTTTASSESASINAIKVRRMITDYHTLTGENPVGTNAEIMAATMGKNPRQAVLGPPDGLNLNSKGELIDEWGTPYFFHQLSRDVMEIHSAGPDRIMGTADDVIVR